MSMSYSEAEAGEQEVNYLVLRQLAKDVNVRLSDPLQGSQSQASANLLALSNPKGLAFAATTQGFIVLQLSTLRTFFKAAARNTSPRVSEPLRTVDTTSEGKPAASKVTFLRTGNADASLVVGFESGAIAAWDIDGLVSGSRLDPAFVLQPPSADLKLLELAPNPSDRPELCVALYSQPGAAGIDAGTAIVLDITKGSWGSQLNPDASVRTSSLCWSVKGKQIALGLEDGEILQITPEGEAKDRIAKPSSLDGPYYISDIRWLENHAFVTTYNQPSSSEQEPEHSYEVYAVLRDPKAKQVTFAKFPADPAPPYGDTSRKGNRYVAWLKGWEPAKHLVFVGSSPSTDVGLLGCSSEGGGAAAWSIMELDETSRPILPFSSLDKSSDTAPVGLELDLTATDEIEDPNAAARGDGNDKMPAVPVLYVYTSDGVLLAYDVINTQGGPFPGMSQGQAASAASSTPAPAQATPAPEATPSAPSTPSAFGQTSKPSAFGQTSTPSAFGQTSTPSAFGQTSTPAFGRSTAFQAPLQTPSPFAAPAKPEGTPNEPKGSTAAQWGSAARTTSNADASARPSGFGSTGFGFGFSSQSTSASTPATPAAADKPAAPASPFVTGSATTPSTPSTAAAATSSTTMITTPAPAFGSTSAFGQTSSPSPFAKPAFGQSSGFGSTSAFGKSAFGSAAASPFASTPTTPAAKAEASTAGSSGFGGFASSTSSGGGFGSFASKGTSAFASATSPSSPGSVFGGGGKLETSTTPSKPFGGSAFGAPSAFGSTSTPTSAFTTSASAFGATSGSAFATNKAAEEKDKVGSATDDAKDAGPGSGGSFSFGGLDDMLGGGKDEKKMEGADGKQPGGKKSDSAASSPDSGVNTVVSAPSTQAPAFSFNKAAEGDKKPTASAFSFGGTGAAPQPSSSSSSSSTTATATAEAGRATSPPAPSPAFSSFKPGFGAGSSFGNQPFSFGGAQNGQQKAGGTSAFGFGAGAAKDGAQKPVSAFAPVVNGQTKTLEGKEDQEKPVEEQDKTPVQEPAEFAKEEAPESVEDKSAESKEAPSPLAGGQDKAASPATEAKESSAKSDEAPAKPAFSFAPKPQEKVGGQDVPAKSAFSLPPAQPSEDKKEDGAGAASKLPISPSPTSGSADKKDAAAPSAFSFAPSPAPGAEATAAPKSPFSFAGGKPVEAGGKQDKKSEEPAKSPFGSFGKPAAGTADSATPKFSFGPKPTISAATDETKKDAVPTPAFGLGSQPAATLSFGSKPSTPTAGFSFGKPAEKKDEGGQDRAVRASTTPPDSPRKPAGAPPPLTFGQPAEADQPVKVKEEPQSPPDLSKPPTPSPFAGFGKPADQGAAQQAAKPAESPAAAATPSSPFGSFGQTQQSGGGFSFGKPAEAPKPVTSPPADQGGAGAKPQQNFLGFNSRAPRSSSPLAGAPVTSDDLSKSPEKAQAGIKPPATPSGEPKPAFSFGNFAPKPAAPSPLGQPSFGGFGQAAAPATFAPPQQQKQPAGAAPQKPSFSFGPSPGAPQTSSTPASQPAFGGTGGGMFGKPASGAFGAAAIPPAQPAKAPLVSGQAPQLGGGVSQLQPGEVTEKGIQGEFLKAYLILTKELGVLRGNVNQCAAFLAQLRQPTGLPESTADFGDASKWSFGDLQKMLELTRRLESETGQLEDKSTGQKRQLAELQSLQLKAEAKREELARFIRARSDPEFAKIVRVRQLGPEHVENQNRLRKTSQLVRDRMQELDEYLALLKNRITNEKLGRSTMRAPTLDSIARATRNITAMASDRVLELDHLALQLDMLRVRPGSAAAGQRLRDTRSMTASMVSNRFARSSTAAPAAPFESVASLADSLPSAGSGAVAANSANRAASAALRAERAKREAKDVFIAARSEPLLNRTAVPGQQGRRAPTKPFESSDLQIAFAKGPVHLAQRPPPPPSQQQPQSQPQEVSQAPVAASSTGSPPPPTDGGRPRFAPPSPAKPLSAYSSPTQPFGSLPAPQQQSQKQQSSFGGFGSSPLTPLKFGAPPAAGIFDLPPEEKPFMPGARPNEGGTAARGHHAAKSKPRSSIAVSLPPATARAGSPGSPAGPAKVSDFFASPPAGGSSAAAAAPAPAKPPVFSGFKNVGGGFGSLGSSTATSSPAASPAGSGTPFSFGTKGASASPAPGAAGGGSSKVDKKGGGFSFASPATKAEPVTFGGLQQPKPVPGAASGVAGEAGEAAVAEAAAPSGSSQGDEAEESYGLEGDEDEDEDEDDDDYEDEDDDEDYDEDYNDEDEDDDGEGYEDEGEDGVEVEVAAGEGEAEGEGDEEGLSAVEEEEEEEEEDEDEDEDAEGDVPSSDTVKA
ncbi:uncharacterized protein PFL1_02404 [Pseudozyma flocculosa PF-1]|uniref:uncharacterized protein n=1 Tax=Pseudozyma flocculosa PF-1 TaxID=1277687 RepID=UPI0004560167|nr:uncharacterized protein PFL1_02404 [Pseudozyma flocculosa PF-1]EPQ30288.1 hypothetical protein PFL1_02404 [Pseudozyma flocculosa PF-1]